ncbi:hypothetical protein SS50377_27209 [Spironucleus salmonicida]|uniref:Uncharacterized protein n=1 Tax=Spironucleus salmonicida TaxID=348837 RepID=V6LWJ9_9EUKA|nr:hypothetical protein SS50377_27209 [Spironucleus salmonicida]|eukprot:EST48955.1 Hypothetical protein SS50377_10800 [Spironucleus salmonicida]
MGVLASIISSDEKQMEVEHTQQPSEYEQPLIVSQQVSARNSVNLLPKIPTIGIIRHESTLFFVPQQDTTPYVIPLEQLVKLKNDDM